MVAELIVSIGDLVSSIVNSTRATLVARVIQKAKREDLKDRYLLRRSEERRFNDEPKFLKEDKADKKLLST